MGEKSERIRINASTCVKCCEPVELTNKIISCEFCGSALHEKCVEYNVHGIVCSYCNQEIEGISKKSDMPPTANSSSKEKNRQKNNHNPTMNQNDTTREKDVIIENLREEFSSYKSEMNKKYENMQRQMEEMQVKMNSLPTVHSNSNSNSDSSVFDVMSKLLDMQIKNDKKYSLNDLPVVNKTGTEWMVFYRAYVQTSLLFSNHENVIRLQKCILCDDIKRIGGDNLFCPDTCNDTVERINKIINRPQDMLRQSAKETLKMEVNHDKKDIDSMINYIIAINNYATLQEKLGSEFTQSSTSLIERFTNKLPIHINEEWQSECIKKENKGETITIMDLSKFLEEKLAILLRLKSTKLTLDKNDDELENESTHSDEENSDCEQNQSEYCGWVDQSDKQQQDYEEKSEENDDNFYEASNNSDQDTRNDVNF